MAKRLNYFKNNQKGVDSMCDIIREYGDERAAETLVKNIEALAETTKSIDKACGLLKITRKQYEDAKALLEKTVSCFSVL